MRRLKVGQVVRCLRNESNPDLCPERFHTIMFVGRDPQYIKVDGHKLSYADWVRPLNKKERGQ